MTARLPPLLFLGSEPKNDSIAKMRALSMRLARIVMTNALTKSKLVDRLFANNGALNIREADEAVRTILEMIVKALGRGQRVEIRGFGSFSISKRESRMSRNPRTGESVAVDGKYVPRFKAGVELKDAVNDAFLKEQEKVNK